jgi:hypothetical protein
VAADAEESDRPHCYGVYVLCGKLTLLSMQLDGIISTDLVGLSADLSGAPVLGSGILGSGIFVCGAGGGLVVRRLQTNAAYSYAKLAPRNRTKSSAAPSRSVAPI